MSENDKPEKLFQSPPFNVARFSMGLAVVSVVLVVLTGQILPIVLALFGGILGFVALVMAMVYKSGLKVYIAAVAALLLNCVVYVIFIMMLSQTHDYANRISCGGGVSQIAKLMRYYAEEDNDGYLPDNENWCDQLIISMEMWPEQLVCRVSCAVIGESSYAINRNVAGRRLSELDPNCVLLFETDLGESSPLVSIESRACYEVLDLDPNDSAMVASLRWNQSGGPEILTVEHHQGKGCNIVFVDMHTQFTKLEDLGQLNWGEPNGVE